jgi:hypothetical protein
MAKHNKKVLAPTSAQEKASSNEVATPSDAYDSMQEKWSLIDSLMGGTTTMRDAGTTYLPQEKAERGDSYENRLGRSILFNGLRDTVRRVTTRPFAKPTMVNYGTEKSLPENFLTIEDDADRTGKNLTQLARELLEDGVKYGKMHLLVDYPRVSTALTKKQEQDSGVRPLLIRIDPRNVIGWTSERTVVGNTVLTQVRIKEAHTELKGDYGTQQVDIVRVYNRDTWEVWEKPADKKTYTLESSGSHTFGAVPFFTAYVNRTDYMQAEPPFEDLAWVNVAHWQSMSDQRNILRFARVAILAASGVSDDDFEDTALVIGCNQLVKLKDPDAKLYYVEHKGTAIKAGEEDLLRLEERMEVLGLQPFIRMTGNATATGKAIDEGKQQSEIQAWIRETEALLTEAYKAAAKWLGLDLPEEFSVAIYDDFAIGLKAAEDVANLIKMREKKEISRTTFLTEVKRRGLLSEGLDIEEETERLEEEGPDLAAMGLGELPEEEE